MKLSISILAAVMVLSASASPEDIVAAESVSRCEQPWFDPNIYDCYGDGVLCPRLAGTPRMPCGDACYSPYQYSCDAQGQLTELPRTNGPMELIAWNPALGALNGKTIQACGRSFYLRDGPPCTYCPQQVVELAGRCPAGNTTSLYTPNGMNTVVPGGQAYYVEANGALGFTQAHSGSRPANVTDSSFEAFENGIFIVTGLINWLACPSASAGNQYQIFAPLPGVTFSDACLPIVVTNTAYSGEPVWQYV